MSGQLTVVTHFSLKKKISLSPLCFFFKKRDLRLKEMLTLLCYGFSFFFFSLGTSLSLNSKSHIHPHPLLYASIMNAGALNFFFQQVSVTAHTCKEMRSGSRTSSSNRHTHHTHTHSLTPYGIHPLRNVQTLSKP